MEKKTYKIVISGLPMNTSSWVTLHIVGPEELTRDELKEAIRELKDMIKNATNFYIGSDDGRYVLIPNPSHFLAFKFKPVEV